MTQEPTAAPCGVQCGFGPACLEAGECEVVGPHDTHVHRYTDGSGEHTWPTEGAAQEPTPQSIRDAWAEFQMIIGKARANRTHDAEGSMAWLAEWERAQAIVEAAVRESAQAPLPLYQIVDGDRVEQIRCANCAAAEAREQAAINAQIRAEGWAAEEKAHCESERDQRWAAEAEVTALRSLLAEIDAMPPSDFHPTVMELWKRYVASEPQFAADDTETFEDVFVWTLRYIVARAAATAADAGVSFAAPPAPAPSLRAAGEAEEWVVCQVCSEWAAFGWDEQVQAWQGAHMRERNHSAFTVTTYEPPFLAEASQPVPVAGALEAARKQYDSLIREHSRLATALDRTNGSSRVYSDSLRELAPRLEAAWSALRAEAAAEASTRQIEELEELRALFDLQHTRDVEAVALWRAEDPEARALTLPDLGTLLDWLVKRGNAAESKARHWRTNHDRQKAIKQRLHGMYNDERRARAEASTRIEEMTAHEAAMRDAIEQSAWAQARLQAHANETEVRNAALEAALRTWGDAKRAANDDRYAHITADADLAVALMGFGLTAAPALPAASEETE